MVGMAMLARRASGKNPCFRSTTCPLLRSVATQTNGVGIFEKSLTMCAGQVKRHKSRERFCPESKPPGIFKCPLIMGKTAAYFSCSSFSSSENPRREM